jgi:hypothetical protein
MYSLANANGTDSSSTLSQLEVSRCRLALMSVLGLHHADCASSASGTGLVDVTSRGAAAEFAGQQGLQERGLRRHAGAERSRKWVEAA